MSTRQRVGAIARGVLLAVALALVPVGLVAVAGHLLSGLWPWSRFEIGPWSPVRLVATMRSSTVPVDGIVEGLARFWLVTAWVACGQLLTGIVGELRHRHRHDVPRLGPCSWSRRLARHLLTVVLTASPLLDQFVGDTARAASLVP